MVVEHHRETALPLEEEARRAVAQALARLRERQADRADPLQAPARLQSLAEPAPAPGPGLRVLAQRPRRLDDVLGGQRDHGLAVELRELRALDAGEPERLPVQRLLEDRPREAGVAE